jgi:hypothetical protein
MTKKDYELVASAFATVAPAPDASALFAAGWLRGVAAMADALQASNHRFDRARFLAACGASQPGAWTR